MKQYCHAPHRKIWIKYCLEYNMIPLNLVYEDELSEAVMKRLLSFFSSKYLVSQSYNKRGFAAIKRDLPGYNQAARYTPFFVLTDLDQYECPLDLIGKWITFNWHPHLIFRVAVREVESWVMADRQGFAKFAAVALKRVPDNPDILNDPKATLFEIIKRSRKRELKEDILPRYPGDRMGPNYNGSLSSFVIQSWDIKNAMQFSPSLRRAYAHLQTFQKRIKK